MKHQGSLRNAENGNTERAVLLRREAAEEIERAIYAIDGMAKAVYTISRYDDVEPDVGIALMELAKAIETHAQTVQALTFDDRAEYVEIVGDTVRSVQ